MYELALFAGSGGGILGGRLLGWRTQCAVEIDPYCRKVLLARQRDGLLPRFPIWDDVRTFDGRPWRGHIDIVTGGFPCQDISVAGKGVGITGERSGLWKEMARIIGEVRPKYAFVENSPMLAGRGLEVVLGDLAEMGYDAEWGVLGARDAGAPHKRERIWVLAYAYGQRESQSQGAVGEKRGRTGDGSGDVADTKGMSTGVKTEWKRREDTARGGADCEGDETKRDEDVSDARDERRRESQKKRKNERFESPTTRSRWWEVEPQVGRVVDGVASRVDRLKAIGNGQVPAVVALAWHTLMSRIEERAM